MKFFTILNLYLTFFRKLDWFFFFFFELRGPSSLSRWKCTFLLLLKWCSSFNLVVYIAFIDYCKIFYINTAKQMLLRWNRLSLQWRVSTWYLPWMLQAHVGRGWGMTLIACFLLSILHKEQEGALWKWVHHYSVSTKRLPRRSQIKISGICLFHSFESLSL